MTTPARLPIHGECRHNHHTTTTAPDVWAALSRAGYSDPDTTAAELVDQLASKLRALAQDYADATGESLSDVAAMRGIRIRPGSPAGSAQDDVGTLIRYCVYPGCPRTYRADVGPQDRGWIRLRGLTVLCPDHSTPATGRTQDTAPPAESHTRSPGDPGVGWAWAAPSQPLTVDLNPPPAGGAASEHGLHPPSLRRPRQTRCPRHRQRQARHHHQHRRRPTPHPPRRRHPVHRPPPDLAHPISRGRAVSSSWQAGSTSARRRIRAHVLAPATQTLTVAR